VNNDGKSGAKGDRLKALVESYGADPRRWPAGEERTAEELAREGDTPAWLGGQRQVDRWLDDAEDIAPSAALLRSIAEIPLRHAATVQKSGWGWLRNAFALAGTIAAAAGLVIGMSTSEPAATSDAASDWDDLSTLALGMDVSEDLAP